MCQSDGTEVLDEFEVEKIKSKNVAITTIAIFLIIALFIFAFIIINNKLKKQLSQHTYYVLDIDKNNKQTVISLLEEENIKYCDSITKIEYYYAVHNISGNIYCNNNEIIGLFVKDKSNLINYIYKNGYVVKK